MSATCCTEEPKGLPWEEQMRRKLAIEAARKAIDDMAALGYVLHTCYSEKYFFIEKKP